MGPEINIFLQSYHAVYIEIPKVACSSFKIALADLLGMDLGDWEGNPHVADFPNLAWQETYDEPLFPGLFAFAFVRNPWGRLVSCYRDKIGGGVSDFTSFSIRPGVADCLAGFEEFTAGMSFEEFAMAVASIPDTDADEHFRSQYTFIANESREIAIDFVGRYESLTSDLDALRQQTGLPDFTLPRAQAAQQSVDYTDFYTPDTRDIVADRFQMDIELFGYEFGD
ncbi:MAG: sulfotransferase family protein [Pseudomonadota bacterium]